jgi:hypothetical protein
MNDSNSEDGVQEDDRDDPGPRSGSSIESLRRQKRKRGRFGDDWVEGWMKIEDRRLGEEADRMLLETDRLKFEREKMIEQSEAREAERFSLQQEQ